MSWRLGDFWCFIIIGCNTVDLYVDVKCVFRPGPTAFLLRILVYRILLHNTKISFFTFKVSDIQTFRKVSTGPSGSLFSTIILLSKLTRQVLSLKKIEISSQPIPVLSYESPTLQSRS